MVNISSNNQYISYDEFKSFAKYFLNKSRELNCNWEWIEKLNDKEGKGFLKLIQIIEIKKKEIDLIENNDEKDEILKSLISKSEYQKIENQCIDVKILFNKYLNKKLNNM